MRRDAGGRVGLKDVLARMRIVELDAPAPVPAPEAKPAAPPRAKPAPAPAGARLDEILRSIPSPRLDERKLPKADAGPEGPSFGEIYRAAGVGEPVHGFGAHKVLEILSSEHFSELEPRSRASALAGFLAMAPGGPVPLKDVIEDAVRRDQALDEYERFLKKKLDDEGARIARVNGELQAEIDEVRRQNEAKIEANRRSHDEALGRFVEWQARKRIEERKLADAVEPFVELNPVSLGGPAGAREPGKES